jgi:tetratricopeptide (TPR) repeat protein
MQLVVGAARLKPADAPWRDAKEEADQVRQALDHLKAQSKGQPLDNQNAVLRIEVLVGLGRDQQAVSDVEALGQTVLAPPLMARLSIAAGQAYLRLGKLAEAAGHIDLGGAGNGTGDPPSQALLELRTQLAAKWLGEQRAKEAAGMLEHVLQHTPETREDYVERMLLLARARLAADPGSAASVARLLEGKRELVRKKGSVDLEAQFDDLLKRAAGNGG